MTPGFSTLACPSWDFASIVRIAERLRYETLELRFVEGEHRLWTRPEFRGPGLRRTRTLLRDAGLDVACVDTSCCFHHVDPAARAASLEEAECTMQVAADLGAPGIRVFGDTVQPGATRAQTHAWIADALGVAARAASRLGVDLWIESHGDFNAASTLAALLDDVASARVGVVWDPVNAWAAGHADIEAEGAALGWRVRHVHLKDLAPGPTAGTWAPALPGTGQFPLMRVRDWLARVGYAGAVSFEWEKKWHPEIPEPEEALACFATWWQTCAAASPAGDAGRRR